MELDKQVEKLEKRKISLEPMKRVAIDFAECGAGDRECDRDRSDQRAGEPNRDISEARPDEISTTPGRAFISFCQQQQQHFEVHEPRDNRDLYT